MDIDRLASEWRQTSGAPSLSVAVLRHGAVLHTGCYGQAHPEMVFQTASVGKQFTAALALLLAASGEALALDDAVAPHLPGLPETWAAVTLRHLLSHTAGIPSSGYESLDYARDYTDSEIVSAIAAGGPLDLTPGTAWAYSNAGYVLAGIAIGRSAGAFYGDLLRERIFAPLGMTSAAANSPDSPVGYLRESGGLVPAAYVSPTLNRLADGGLCLSILDFIRWETALSGDWGTRLAEMFREMVLKDGTPTGYGLGWSLSRTDRGRIAEHDGAWQGFSTAMVRCLDEGLSAVVLADVAGADASGLAHALLDAARASR